MPPVVRKRPGNLASAEIQVKEGLNTTKKRKKLEEQPCSESTKKKNSKSSTSSAKNSSTLKPSSVKKVENKKQKRQSKSETKKEEIQNIPVEDINNMDVSQLLALGETSEVLDYVNNEASSHFENTSDSEMSDFEEVKNVEITEPVIPKEGVDITLEGPVLYNRHKKRGIDLEAHLKRQLNRVKKDMQYLMHKVHLLCWIAHIRFVNNTINTPSVMKTCLTLVKSRNLYPSKHSDLSYLEGILKWFHKNFELKKNFEDPACTGGLLKELSYQLEKKQAFSIKAFILMFIILLRVLGLKARIVMSFQVLPVRPPTSELYDNKIFKEENKSEKNLEEPSCSKVKNEDEKVKIEKEETDKNKKSARNSLLVQTFNEKLKCETNTKRKSMTDNSSGPKSKKNSKNKENDSDEDSSDDDFESKHFKLSIKSEKGKTRSNSKKNKDDFECDKKSTNKRSVTKSKKNSSKEEKSKNTKVLDSDEDEEDFQFKSLKKKESKKKVNRKSTDSEESQGVKKKEGYDLWLEVFLEAEEKWICVDVPKQKIHCIGELYSRATHPVVYVIACNNNLTLKDVTKRYVPNWHSDTRKRRVDEAWWNETMKPYLPPKTAQDREEDEDIDRQLSDKPLPAVISEYKDHPLYALKRHLLKFEAIYPPEAPTLGFVRGEPVYARECVVTLHSREMWYKQARVVRLKEEPYKIVKARPKYDKMTGEVKKDLPLELFGKWQTEDYIPPIAVDGKVPRNEYGNVDLFKPSMLPIGTVHLQIPALNRIAKKLGIDCAPATVGFDFHSGGSHPVFDGFVVCEEFKEKLLDVWNKEIDESAKRNEEKREKRIYGNWKRLIRGLLIREKLKIKYAFGENSDEEEASTSKETVSSSPKSN